MGDTVDDLLLSFDLSEADRKKYKPVKDKFDSHFVIKKNVIYERAKFNTRSQKEGEPVDSFVTDLYTLAEFCNFGNLRKELIRDRLVVGILNKQLSEKLRLDIDLTLEKVIIQPRQKETIKNNKLFSVKSRLIISKVSRESLINTEVPLKIKERNPYLFHSRRNVTVVWVIIMQEKTVQLKMLSVLSCL